MASRQLSTALAMNDQNEPPPASFRAQSRKRFGKNRSYHITYKPWPTLLLFIDHRHINELSVRSPRL
jgi:hypothetical protein